MTTSPPPHRHGLLVGLLAAGTAAVVLVGLLVWSTRPRDPDLTAVREAVEALLVAPAVRVRTGSADGAVRADLSVTPTGETVGDVVVDGTPYELLAVDDRHWLRNADGRLPGDAAGALTNPSSAALAAELLASRWVAVDLDALHPTWRVPSPAAVATRVRSAIADPAAVGLDGNGPPVDGRPTIVARTPVGDVHVSRERPHRVLRVAPPGDGVFALGARAPGPALALVASRQGGGTPPTPVPAAPVPGAELDLTDLGAEGAQQVYDDVEGRVPELAEAADATLQLSHPTEPRITCGAGGCSVQASVLASVRTSGQLTPGAGQATLTADFSIGGQPAGRCSARARLPVNTPSPVECSVPEAGPVFTAVRNAARSAAIAATAPGGTARWRVPYKALVVVLGRVEVDVTELRRVVEDSRAEAVCLTEPTACPEPPSGGPFTGRLVAQNTVDAHADRLAGRLHGRSRVAFEGDPDRREFDVVSDRYVAQAKPATVPYGKPFRDQAKATFDAARQSGRSVYYHFEGGAPRSSVVGALERYSQRYGVPVVIDTEPL
jgi:hypothetical protein